MNHMRAACGYLAFVIASAAWSQTDSAASHPDRLADRGHRYLSGLMTDTVQRVDSFFESDNYTDELATTRVKIRHSTFFTAKDTTESRLRVSGRVHLPRFSKRVSLVLEGNDDQSLMDLDSDLAEEYDGVEDDFDRASVGLEYFQRAGQRLDFRMSAGVRADPAIYLGPRLRYKHAIGTRWLGRYIETLRWYTDDGWDSDTRIDFDRSLGSQSLFRQTFRARWQEERRDNRGFSFSITSALSQFLDERSALRYQWRSVYFTEPQGRWHKTSLAVRYRRQFWRDWFFVELVPEISWEEEFDWETNPGFRIVLEVLLSSRKAMVDQE